MSYLILNKKIKENSFLRSQFEISDLAHLFIGKNSYVDTLLGFLPVIDSSKILFTDEVIESLADLAKFLQYRDVNFKKLSQEEDIFYYDLNLFPKDPAKLKNIFEKLHFSEELALFFESNTSKEKNLLPIFKIKANLLAQNFYSETSIFSRSGSALEIDLSNSFLFLDKTSDLLQLFSSNFQLRYFNHILSQDDYFVKSSSKSEKMFAEFNFLTNIPAELRPYYPQVGEYRINPDNNSYQIEKIYMFDVSKHLINRVLNQDNANKLLHKLNDYLARLPRVKVSKDEYKDSIRKNFLEKNQERFDQLQEIDIHKKLDQLAIFQGYASCKQVFDLIQSAIQNYLIDSDENELFFSHGDLCFSNILFDTHTLSMKLIDPRGFVNNIQETYRPIYYDLAKLSHSFMGLYDLIVYDLVDIKFDNNGNVDFDYLLDITYLEKLSSAFENFTKKLGYDLGLIRLFEASLFMSMIPLHKDGEKKMLAQFLQAIRSLEASKKVIKNTKIYK